MTEEQDIPAIEPEAEAKPFDRAEYQRTYMRQWRAWNKGKLPVVVMVDGEEVSGEIVQRLVRQHRQKVERDRKRRKEKGG